MPFRLALAQLNPRLGDLAGNVDLALEAVRAAAGAGADLVALPEMLLTGYPVEDLALRRSFQAASRRALQQLARRLNEEGLGALPVLVGYLDGPGMPGDDDSAALPAAPGPQNAVGLVHSGAVHASYAKHHLPNYGVFDEARYFVPGRALLVVRVEGVDVAVAVCEDLWQEGGPVSAARAAGVSLLVVVNGSPYERAKGDVRLDLVRRRAAQAGCPLAYVNLVGGQDELVFDGSSLVVDTDGEVLARGLAFQTDLVVLDLDLPAGPESPAAQTSPTFGIVRTEVPGRAPRETPPLPPRSVQPASADDEAAEVYAALVVGTRDYVDKNGFTDVLLGLSGGIDSALTATIACDALGATHVHALGMPSRHSSQHSRDDAADLAGRTGLNYTEVAIEPLVQAFLGPLHLDGLALENLQARVRGMVLMSLANQHGRLVLATGNKSELAVGYSTIYGDAVGAFAPLKDVLKTRVWRLSRWRNADAEARGLVAPIPEDSITKPPSAELSPGQLDTDSLPDYDVLDALLEHYVERDVGGPALVAQGFDAALVQRVLRLVDLAEYKRRQYPPGPKVSARNFGRDRRLPMTNAWREDL